MNKREIELLAPALDSIQQCEEQLAAVKLILDSLQGILESAPKPSEVLEGVVYDGKPAGSA